VRRKASALLVAALLGAACVAPARPEVRDLPLEQAFPAVGAQDATAGVTSFFDAYAAGQFGELAASATGPARTWADYLAFVLPLLAAGAPLPAVEVVEELVVDSTLPGGRARVGGSLRLTAGEQQATYTRFEVRRAGDRWLLETLERDGDPLGTLVLAGRRIRPTSDQGVTARPVGAFRSAVGALNVAFRVTNGTDAALRPDVDEATFTVLGGRVRQVTNHTLQPATIPPNGTASVVLVFTDDQSVDAGGTMELTAGSAALSLELPAFVAPE